MLKGGIPPGVDPHFKHFSWFLVCITLGHFVSFSKDLDWFKFKLGQTDIVEVGRMQGLAFWAPKGKSSTTH